MKLRASAIARADAAGSLSKSADGAGIHNPSGPGAAGPRVAALDLARLMPLHAILTPEGEVLAAGPMLSRLFPGAPVVGRSFLSLFEIRGGPGRISDMAGLTARLFQKLHVSPHGMTSGLRLRGMAVPLSDGRGVLVNLSFGIDVVRAVRQLHLSDADFAPTELAMELLYLAEAIAAVRGEMRELSLRLVDARQQAQQEALTDPLTGLRNRRACDSFLSRLCREASGFSLIHIDLDYFKQVNDKLGHAAGDHVLQRVARTLTGLARSSDCLARVGGDEFMVVMPGLTDADRLISIGEAIVEALACPIPFHGEVCCISGSVGFAIVPEGISASPAEVLSEADMMLYAAKEAGRGRVLGTRLPV
jgi:diguanylate cyclase (GGDEF)-like protein